MKKLILISIIAVLLLGAALPVAKLMRLEVVNKSIYPATLKITEVLPKEYNGQPFYASHYYLTVSGMEENGLFPTVETFTLIRGFYDIKLWYCGLSEPTYMRVDLTWSAVKFPIPKCGSTPPPGDPQHIKLNPNLYPPTDVLGVPIYYDFGYRWRY